MHENKDVVKCDEFLANYNVTILDISKVIMGDNVWIGGNVTTLPGVTFGKKEAGDATRVQVKNS